MAKEVFTIVTLPSGFSIKVYELIGADYFQATSYSKGDTGLLLKSLISSSCYLDGKSLTFQDLDKMPIQDASYLTEVVSLMLTKTGV
jgi:hypothetical protein